MKLEERRLVTLLLNRDAGTSAGIQVVVVPPASIVQRAVGGRPPIFPPRLQFRRDGRTPVDAVENATNALVAILVEYKSDVRGEIYQIHPALSSVEAVPKGWTAMLEFAFSWINGRGDPDCMKQSILDVRSSRALRALTDPQRAAS